MDSSTGPSSSASAFAKTIDEVNSLLCSLPDHSPYAPRLGELKVQLQRINHGLPCRPDSVMRVVGVPEFKGMPVARVPEFKGMPVARVATATVGQFRFTLRPSVKQDGMAPARLAVRGGGEREQVVTVVDPPGAQTLSIVSAKESTEVPLEAMTLEYQEAALRAEHDELNHSRGESGWWLDFLS